jgi:hypothetical protein
VSISVVKCSWISVVKCSEVLQCSDDLSNKVSNIIRRLIDNMELLLIFIHSFIHLVVCLTTGPKPLPKPALHVVPSRASSFK